MDTGRQTRATAIRSVPAVRSTRASDPLRAPPFQARHQPDVFGDREVREQARFLNDVTNPAAQPDGVPRGGGPAFHQNLAGSRREQPVHHLERRGFSGAASAQQHQRLAALHREGQRAQNVCRSLGPRDGVAGSAKFHDGAHEVKRVVGVPQCINSPRTDRRVVSVYFPLRYTVRCSRRSTLLFSASYIATNRPRWLASDNS